MDTESLVRRVFDAFNSHQFEARIELFDRDIEVVPLRAALENVIYRGHDGVRQFDRDTDTSWSERHVEILDLEVRAKQALVIGRLCLKGRASDALTEQTAAWTICVRNGRVTRLAIHQTAEGARHELGWEA